jgi:hypothetical protein
MEKYQEQSSVLLTQSGVFSQRQVFAAILSGVLLAGAPIDASAKNYSESYTANGNTRTIVVRGVSLGEIHRVAANNFVHHLEADFKSPGKYYAVKNFKTNIGKGSWSYTMSYSLELVPVEKWHTHFQIVDMRWSVVDGKTPEQTAKSINQSKVPNWQKSMSQKYTGMQYLRAVDANSTLYHEAFIGLGETTK